MTMAKCPFCDIEVSLDAVEADDGCCPECGAAMTPSMLFENEDDFVDLDDDPLDDLAEEEDERDE